MADNNSINDLQKFNDAVIKALEASKDEKTGKVPVFGVNFPNKNMAITHLSFSDKPGLAFVELEEDLTGKVPLYDRVKAIIMIMTFEDTKSVQKMMQWLAVIHDFLFVDGKAETPLEDLV